MKEKKFNFRISEEQLDLLKLKAESVNMNLSEFLIKSTETSNINLKSSNKKDLKKLIWNINKIGVNINQLSHGLNYSKLDKYSYYNLINKLVIIEKQLDSILEKEF